MCDAARSSGVSTAGDEAAEEEAAADASFTLPSARRLRDEGETGAAVASGPRSTIAPAAAAAAVAAARLAALALRGGLASDMTSGLESAQ